MAVGTYEKIFSVWHVHVWNYYCKSGHNDLYYGFSEFCSKKISRNMFHLVQLDTAEQQKSAFLQRNNEECQQCDVFLHISVKKYRLITWFLDLFSVSLTGSWRVPIFVVVVTLIIVGSQEKPPTPGRGEVLCTHTCTHTQNGFQLMVSV